MNKAYWESRYQEAATGWDIGKVSPPIKSYVDQLTDKNLRILIPGGGNSYEAEYLWSQGLHNVFVNDFAEQPLLHLKERAPNFPQSNLLLKDFFEIDQQFDLILEQTFFCALTPDKRPAYAEKMNELLLPEGRLAGLLFNTYFEKEGPPFGGNTKEYLDLFHEKFDVKTLEACYNSILPRQGNEL